MFSSCEPTHAEAASGPRALGATHYRRCRLATRIGERGAEAVAAGVRRRHGTNGGIYRARELC